MAKIRYFLDPALTGEARAAEIARLDAEYEAAASAYDPSTYEPLRSARRFAANPPRLLERQYRLQRVRNYLQIRMAVLPEATLVPDNPIRPGQVSQAVPSRTATAAQEALAELERAGASHRLANYRGHFYRLGSDYSLRLPGVAEAEEAELRALEATWRSGRTILRGYEITANRATERLRRLANATVRTEPHPDPVLAEYERDVLHIGPEVPSTRVGFSYRGGTFVPGGNFRSTPAFGVRQDELERRLGMMQFQAERLITERYAALTSGAAARPTRVSLPIVPSSTAIDELLEAERAAAVRVAASFAPTPLTVEPPQFGVGGPRPANAAERLALARITSVTIPTGTVLTAEEVYSRMFTARTAANVGLRLVAESAARVGVGFATETVRLGLSPHVHSGALTVVDVANRYSDLIEAASYIPLGETGRGIGDVQRDYQAPPTPYGRYLDAARELNRSRILQLPASSQWDQLMLFHEVTERAYNASRIAGSIAALAAVVPFDQVEYRTHIERPPTANDLYREALINGPRLAPVTPPAVDDEIGRFLRQLQESNNGPR
jgi:hypothetical protein